MTIDKQTFVSPLSEVLALKLVLTTFLYRRNKGYSVMNYAVFRRTDFTAMLGKSVPHSVVRDARPFLEREGYSLLQIDRDRFILIRLAQLSKWTKLGPRYARKLKNDTRVLRAMLDTEREDARPKTLDTVYEEEADHSS